MIAPKKLFRLQAFACATIGLIAAFFAVGPEGGDLSDRIASGFLATFAFGYAGYLWRAFQRTPADAVFESVETSTPKTPAEQIKVFTRAIGIVVVLGPLVSGWIYFLLQRLERGEDESTSVWAPIAMLYEFFGFWPAVLCLPVLCLLGLVSLVHQRETAKSLLDRESS